MSRQLLGWVVDRTGAGVPEATVVVIRAPGPVPDIAAVSDTNGRFTFGEMPAGRYRLRALGPDGGTGEDDVTVPGQQAVIRLAGSAAATID